MNGDGNLSLSEFREFANAPGVFYKLDRNQDGYVSASEIQFTRDSLLQPPPTASDGGQGSTPGDHPDSQQR